MTTRPEFIAHYRVSDRAEQTAEQTLSAHLLTVGTQAARFGGKLGLALPAELIGLVHDLGKYSDEFQSYLKSAVGLLNQDDEDFVDAKGLKGKIDHSTAGAQLLWQELAQRGQMGQIVGQALALCVASHHSGLIDCLTSDERSLGEDAFGRRMKKVAERTHLPEVLEKADSEVVDRIREAASNPALLTALRDVMARIVRRAPGGDDKGIVAHQQFGLLTRFLFSCLVDADRTDTVDFEKSARARIKNDGRPADWDTLIDRLEEHLAGLAPDCPIDHLRREISDHCLKASSRARGIYALTVPTGGGKTLASLRFALHHARTHGMDRIIYFIPFTTIIDQNAAQIRRILEPRDAAFGSVVLEHHSNLTPEEETWRTRILSENWDAPVIVTTNVQCLETLFGAGTRSVRRMHQLANAVLVFDEIQTLPVNCVHLFNNAINFLVDQCNSTALLCTATQPLLDQVNPAKGAIRMSGNHELMPDVRSLFDKLKRVDVLNRRVSGGWTNEAIVDLALDETARTGSCLVIVNTKEAARTHYRLCEGRTAAWICHLSTNMCPTHRKEVLDEIRDRLAPDGAGQVICFSTQLIEAGVDVDFGSVIRFAAGLDSVAQAAGRCNRNGHRPTGRVHVVNPRDENLDRLLEIGVGRDTAARVMDDYEQEPEKFGWNLVGPSAMNWYYKNYFFARAESMAYTVSAQSLGHDDTLLNLLSVNSLAVDEYGRRNGQKPNLYLRQSFMAAGRAFKAIDAPTRGVVVPYGAEGRSVIADLCAAHQPDKEVKLLRRAQRFSVNVFPYVLDRLMQAGAVHEVLEGTGILCLDSRYYSRHFGLSETSVGEMELLHA